MTEKRKILMLLDGNGLAYRAFYALPPLETSSGEKVQAVYGFTTMLLKVIDEIKPDYVACSFDKAPPAERLKEFGDYKAHRQKMPESLASQFSLIERMLSLFNIPEFYVEGHEADDCIGTMALQAASQGYDVVIVSGDLDLLQIVSPRIKVLTPRKGISDVQIYDVAQVQEKFGLEPSQIIDMKALAGDPSDNIPGVPGIGEVTARRLVKEYGSLEKILENLDSVPSKGQELIRNSIDSAKLSKKLATIKTDLSLPIDLAQCERKAPLEQELREFLIHLEFESLLKKLFPEEKNTHALVTSIEYTTIDSRKTWEMALECLEKSDVIALYRIGRGAMPISFATSCIAVATEKKEIFYLSFVLDLMSASGDERDLFSEKFIMGELGRLFEHDKTLWGYDCKEWIHVFSNYEIPPPSKFLDVAAAAHLLDPQDSSPKLSAIYKRYTGMEIVGREELLTRKADSASPLDIAQCAASGAAAILELAPHLVKKCAESELDKVLYDVELPFLPVVAKLERNGIFVDVNALKEISAELQARASSSCEKIFEMAGEKFNVNSPRQLGEILFGKLGIPGQKKTTQGYSTSQEILQTLSIAYPIVSEVLAYKEVKKLQSTYTDALPELICAKTGRIHTTFNPRGTATGRLSSSEPNLQNIPVRSQLGQLIRKAFKPQQEGYVFVEADYSQIDLRVLAHLSEDEHLIEAFQADEDIHTITASELFGVEPRSVDTAMRRKAKEINFGILYGMSAHGLAQRTGISRHEAKQYIDTYMERFDGVRRFIETTIANARARGFVTTILGRKRWLPDLGSRNMTIQKQSERIAINTPVQGSSADLTKLAMIAVQREIEERRLDAMMILQVHDELLFEVRAKKSEDVCRKVKGLMEGIYPLAVPLKVNMKKGADWASMEEMHPDHKTKEVVGAQQAHRQLTLWDLMN